MKHNKKRNTAFLYECLIRELTKAIIKENKEQQTVVKTILREFFSTGKPLRQELNLYNSLLESKEMSKDYSQRFLVETKKDFDNMNRKEVFNEQTALINRINKALGSKTFSNFVPNYKDLATISQLFDDDVTVKEKMVLESKIVKKLTSSLEEKKDMQPITNLAYKTFIKKYNS